MIFFQFSQWPTEWAQKFKFLQNSCRVKWFHETELQGPGFTFNNFIQEYRLCLENLLDPPSLFILISSLGIRLVWIFSYQSYMPVRCAQSKVCLAAAWAEISAHSATLLVAWFRVGALTEFNKSHGLTHAATAEGLPYYVYECTSSSYYGHK